MSQYNNNITGETIINNVYNMYYEIPLFLDGHSLIINQDHQADHQADQNEYIMQVACSNGEKNKKRTNQRKRRRTNQKKRRKAKAKAKAKSNAKKRRKARQNKKIQIQIQIQICSYCSKDITTGDQHCYKKYRL